MKRAERLRELLVEDDFFDEDMLRYLHDVTQRKGSIREERLDEKGKGIPLYGYENGPTMEKFMRHAVLENAPKLLNLTPEHSLYQKSRGEDVYPQDRYMYYPNRDPYNVPQELKMDDVRLRNELLLPRLDESIATPVKVAQEAGIRKTPHNEQEAITRFDDGVSAAIKQTGLSWKYLLKNAQKKFTADEEKQKEIQKEIDEIGEEYSAIPPMKGMAQIGAIGANVVGIALPTVIAGALLSPPAAAAVGGALTTLDMAGTASQANIEIDSYERTTGNKVSENERAAYTAASVATDAIMNVLMGSKVLKNASPGVREALSKELKEKIMKNPVAQQEFNAMTRQVLKNEMKNMPYEVAESMAKSGVEAGVASGAMESEKSIYTGEAPELERVINSVIGGFASGMVQGVVGGAMAPMQKHQERMAKDDVYYVSRMTDENKSQLPISELEPQAVHSKGKSTYVKGEVSPSTGVENIKDEFDARNISVGSYRKAHEQGATTDKLDGWSVDTARMKDYEKVWSDATKGRSDEEYYAMRNEVVQSIAADMGVPVKVYRSYRDLPEELKNVPNMGENGAVTVNHDGIYVILDNCEHITASNLSAVLRHEAAGHYGLRKLYGSKEAYEADLDKIGAPVYGGRKDYEEAMSLQAERRDQYQGHSENENVERVYELLRKSEENLRNSTMSELRNLPGKLFLDFMFKDGKPMPSLYDIEWKRQGL